MISAKELASFNDDQESNLNEKELIKLGGVAALESKLKTNYKKGLSGDAKDIAERVKLYGKNEFPEPESQTWIQMFLGSFADATLIVLIVAAVVSLVVGVMEDPAKGWIEGAAILFAVLLVAVVTATNDFNKESQFRKLNAVKDDIKVGVLRNGAATTLDVKKLVVGDILILNAGDRVPTDGLLVEGSDVTCNESALTGESDDKKKTFRPSSDGESDPFMLSGSSLATGYALVLVTAVGEQSRWGRTKAKLAAESSDTPLQEKLDTLAGQIGNLGMVAAAATFVAMIAIWFYYPEQRNPELNIYEYVLKAFIMAVTIVVVAVPEGLPLAVTLSLAYSTQKMMQDNNLIRVLAACETMGNATNICSDKTGTLTQNRMTVVEAWVCGKSFVTAPRADQLPSEVVEFIAEGASVNSTVNVVMGKNGELPTVNGNKTEGALVMMVGTQLGQDYVSLRTRFNATRGDRLFTFSSARKRMSVVLVNGQHGGAKSGICYTKGAAEIIVESCDHYIDAKGAEKPITNAIREQILTAIKGMAKNALRAIALSHRRYTKLSGDEVREELEEGLTLDAIFGIKDPLRPDVKRAVEQCQEAGIFVRMVTGDNIDTAKAIATECGILTEGGIAMEGPVFRKLTPAQLDAVLPNLQVLARSSPDDKHTLVTRLNGMALPETQEDWETLHPDAIWDRDRSLLLPGYKEEWAMARADGVGEVVGVTGDGTNDGPALKAADVGLSMGLTGTDVAKEASDIVILDDNFSSIVKSVMWGRSVFDNIRKFLQFQLTVNVVALTLTFVCAVTGSEPPLNAVMMLWVNLIMDTMGALALGTEPPSAKLLQRRPYKRNASLISNKMYRNITLQFIFQMGILCYLLMFGAPHFGVVENSTEHLTIIFNTFVFCQVFNELNARSIGDEMNIFKGLHQSPLFIGIILFTVVAQYGIVEFGGDFVRTVHLDQEQWIKCVLLGALSLPVGGVMRLIPVSDSTKDFAEMSELITANRAKAMNGKRSTEKRKQDASSDDGFSFSFLVWFLLVTAIPVVVAHRFNEHWKLIPDM